jgi:NAD(P)-dependent dehydrogenase (short-subunit alcohol dehydrogenase family)
MGVVLTFNAHPEAAETVVETIRQKGGQAMAIKLDVSDTASFPAFRAEVAQRLEEIWMTRCFDILVNNAGFGQFNPIASVTENQFDALYCVHLKGPFFLTQCLLPLMVDGGHIVNIGSATTRVATSGVAPYAAFKGGLEVLTRYMAKEFADRRIRANSIAPGAIRTDLGGGLTDQFEALLAGQTALGRIGEPDDIGAMIASLLGEDNRWINAQNIEVSGGYVV